MERSSPEWQFRNDQIRIDFDKAKLAEAEGRRELAGNRVSLFIANMRVNRRSTDVKLGRNVMTAYRNFAALYTAAPNLDTGPVSSTELVSPSVEQPPQTFIDWDVDDFGVTDEQTAQRFLHLVRGND